MKQTRSRSEQRYYANGGSQGRIQSNHHHWCLQKRVDNGKWHKIRVIRKRRIGVLQIDDDKPVRGRAEKGASVLNTDGKVWIGKLNL